MLKRGYFINRKYKHLMFGNAISWTAYSLNYLIDAVLGGNQLGETALTAVSIVSPLFIIVNLTSFFFSPGFGVMYGKSNGEFDHERSYCIAGENIISSFFISIATCLALFFVKTPFLNYYGCTGELLDSASAYYNWLLVFSLIVPVTNAISYLIVADCDAVSILIGTTLNLSSNIILSYILSKYFGVAGLGMATAIAAVLNTLGYCVHFLRKSSSVHIRMDFKLKDFTEAFTLSISRSSSYLFIAAVDIIMNKIIIETCSEQFIPAYSIVNLAFAVFEIVGGAFDSGEGMIAAFLGEKNNYGINNVMKIMSKTTLILELVLAALFFFAAPYFPVLYGITSKEVAAACVRTARVMALTAVPFGFSYLYIEIYATLEKSMFSMIVSFLLNFFCPLAISIPFAYKFGFNGISMGMMLSSYLVIVMFCLYLFAKKGIKGFPLYVEDFGEEAVSFDLKINKENIVVLRDRISGEMKTRGFEINNVDILVEELYTRIMEKNPERKVMSECTLLFGEGYLRLIIRDNGMVFNFMDENNVIESLNAHVLNCLLEQTKNKQYILTTSFNRNGFVFNK